MHIKMNTLWCSLYNMNFKHSLRNEGVVFFPHMKWAILMELYRHKTYFHSGPRWQLAASAFNNKASSMRPSLHAWIEPTVHTHCCQECNTPWPHRQYVWPMLCVLSGLSEELLGGNWGRITFGGWGGITFHSLSPRAPSYGRILECLAAIILLWLPLLALC